MNHLTPQTRLMQGIARLDLALNIARETEGVTPPPGGEALAEISSLLAQAHILISGLRGQLVVPS